MLDQFTKNDLFHEYYSQWIDVYKRGAVRQLTLNKYQMTLSWVKKLAPTLIISDLNRVNYQKIINDYAATHERQTTVDFHHQLKGAILDAVDEGLIDRDPTKKVVLKGKQPRAKKAQYLNQFELHALLSSLVLSKNISFDWLILLIAKTGLRFSEALGLTPEDFDFAHQCIYINKTWDYKYGAGFQPTKNKTSKRKVQIDWQLVIQFSELIKSIDAHTPIFIGCNEKRAIFNSTINNLLKRRCEAASIPVISVHGLRHTHASLLLYAGVSVASVAKRLGHASTNTTQKTYLHIIQELENQDLDLVMRSLSSLI